MDIRDKTFIFHEPSVDIDGRLDKFLFSKKIFGLSRSRIQEFIKAGSVTVNNRGRKPSYRLKSGDIVRVSYLQQPGFTGSYDNFELDIIHEDSSLLVVNKPPGLVVHPHGSNNNITLVHALLNKGIELSALGGPKRPGIVHRLDKDTSGTLIVAKNDKSHQFLSNQFKQRKIKKRYLTIVHGCLKQGKGEVSLPISRHPVKRKEMSVSLSDGKTASTEWETLSIYSLGFSLLKIIIHTGRTHQIRVHMAYMGHPVVGDFLYGYGKRWWKRQFSAIEDLSSIVKRQMLHSKLIGFIHPDSKRYVEFNAPVPEDMVFFLRWLNENEK